MPEKLQYLDRPGVPEIFADAIPRASFRDHHLKINLYAGLLDLNGKETRQLVAHLALSQQAALDLHGLLNQIVSQLKAQSAAVQMKAPPRTVN